MYSLVCVIFKKNQPAQRDNMEKNQIDLKQLLFMIKENKKMDANLILDEGCTLNVPDSKPLIKILNYIINYFEQFIEQALEISLDLYPDNCALTFLGYTKLTEFPPLSSQLDEALKDYNAVLKTSHEQDRYYQIRILFSR
jgi:hypothetical protein